MKNWALQGKRALVTGGTKGIGKAIAEEFLELGAAVAGSVDVGSGAPYGMTKAR